jgi:hypothetical protein
MPENLFDIIKPVTDAERAEYPGMVTPTFLRNLAVGLENGNSGAEDLARCIKSALAERSSAMSIAAE